MSKQVLRRQIYKNYTRFTLRRSMRQEVRKCVYVAACSERDWPGAASCVVMSQTKHVQ